MSKVSAATLDSVASHLRSLISTPEVLRLVNDITTCSVEWEDHPDLALLREKGGIELFPCFSAPFHHHLMEVRGTIFANLQDERGLSHLIRLEIAGAPLYLRLRTTQTAFLLSPFHWRFLSLLFGRVVLHQFMAQRGAQNLLFTPYSLEEQVVASYFRSLNIAPCATIKLDAQDNPYIGSMLHTQASLRRCGVPDNTREEAIIRAWRLFKRLLYYSVEGERLFTGFAFLSNLRPLDYYRQRINSLLWYDEANYTPLDLGLQALRQFLLNADGHSTFLALYAGRIVGLLHHTQGSNRQLTTVTSWRSALPLATISHRGRLSFWVALRGRKSPLIPLSILEYRHGHLHIPLFQDIFWQELERQLKEVCPGAPVAGALPSLQGVLERLRRSGHGGILLVGLSPSQLADVHTPIESQVRLAHPVLMGSVWLPHLVGLAKSDGALIFNNRLEACQFRARLKPTSVCLLPDQDDLGSGMRHQVTREFTAYDHGVLGICISQDGYISLYRKGKLVSRLY